MPTTERSGACERSGVAIAWACAALLAASCAPQPRAVDDPPAVRVATLPARLPAGQAQAFFALDTGADQAGGRRREAGLVVVLRAGAREERRSGDTAAIYFQLVMARPTDVTPSQQHARVNQHLLGLRQEQAWCARYFGRSHFNRSHVAQNRTLPVTFLGSHYAALVLGWTILVGAMVNGWTAGRWEMCQSQSAVVLERTELWLGIWLVPFAIQIA